MTAGDGSIDEFSTFYVFTICLTRLVSFLGTILDKRLLGITIQESG
jgi:hypothetical protein